MAKKTDAPESSADQTQSDHGRTFKVVKGQVGPWSASDNHAFTEAEFRKLHPIHDTPQTRAEIDPATYHVGLINRLLSLGVIAHAPDATPTPTPLNPDGAPQNPVKNAAITGAVNESNAAKEQTAQLRANDQAQAAASNGPTAPVEAPGSLGAGAGAAPVTGKK